MADGLNISQRSGEGEANVLNWGDFHNTLNRIYQRDIQNQQAINNQYQKSEMQLLETAKGLRTPDIPKFKEYADNFKQASLMLMNPKVKSDPQQVAFWKNQQQESYINGVTHAAKSKQIQADLHGVNTTYAQRKGVGMLAPQEYSQQYEHVNSLPSDQIEQGGFNLPTAWSRPTLNFPHKDLIDAVRGKIEKSKEMKRDIAGDPTKQEVYVTEGSKFEPHKIATLSVAAFLASPDAYDFYRQVYEHTLNTDPQSIKSTVDEATKVDPNFPQIYDPAHYFAATMINEGKSKETVLRQELKKQPPLSEEQKMAAYKERATFAAGLRVKVAQKIKDMNMGETGNKLLKIQDNAIKTGKAIPVPELGDTLYETKEVPELIKKYPKIVGYNSKGTPIKATPDAAGFDKDGNLRLIFKERDETGQVVSDKPVSYEIVPLDKVAESIYEPEKKQSAIDKMVSKVKGFVAPKKETSGKKQYKGLDKDGNPKFE